jgi:hypothetical protein
VENYEITRSKKRAISTVKTTVGCGLQDTQRKAALSKVNEMILEVAELDTIS